MKKSIKKTILTLIAIITLMSTVAILPTYAALPDTGETVQPRWSNTEVVNIAISYPEKGYGFSECVVIGSTGVSKIVIEIVVYRKVLFSWVQVAEMQETINNYFGGSSCQFTPVEGATYKSTYKITVTKNNVDEVIEKEMTRVCDFD